MKLPRRRFLYLAAGAASLPATRNAHAQTYPARPLRWIVGFPPGGGASIVTRIVAEWVSERLPDGYTLLFVAASAAVNVTLFDTLPFNLLRDIAPVAGLIDFPLVLVVNPSVPAKNVPELIDYAKANPGKVTMGSFGTGSTSHVAGELFQLMADVHFVHVPYRGSAPMITDLIGGQVQIAFDTMPTSLPHIRSGALRALAMAGKSRFAALPDVPAIGETVAGYEANSWGGVGVPRGTPTEIIERLNREINAGLADPAVKARLEQVATVPLILSPAEFGAYMAAEVEKWGKVIKRAGIRPE